MIPEVMRWYIERLYASTCFLMLPTLPCFPALAGSTGGLGLAVLLLRSGPLVLRQCLCPLCLPFATALRMCR